MKNSIEPGDGGLGGSMIERTPRPKQRAEMAEQPTDATVIIERSLGQIKAEKEAIEKQIQKLQKLVESPADIRALEALQKRADTLAADYAKKIAALNEEYDEVTEPGVPHSDVEETVDDSMIEEIRPATSSFEERMAARRAKLKLSESPIQAPAGEKGQFQHFFDEAAGKQPTTATEEIQRRPPPPPEDAFEETVAEPQQPEEIFEEVDLSPTPEEQGTVDLGTKIEALAREHGVKAFVTPEERDEEQQKEKAQLQELLHKATITDMDGKEIPLGQLLDTGKMKTLRQKTRGYDHTVASRLLALALPSAPFRNLADIANRADAIHAAKLHTELIEKQTTFTNSDNVSLRGEEKKRARKEEGELRKKLEHQARGFDLSRREEPIAEAVRAYEDYVTEYEPEAALPARSYIEGAARLSNNQKKIARDLLESYQRYVAEQESKKKPKMSLERFVADNQALKTKKTERQEAVNALRTFFGLKEISAETPFTLPTTEAAPERGAGLEEATSPGRFDRRGEARQAQDIDEVTSPERPSVRPEQAAAWEEIESPAPVARVAETRDITATVKDFLKSLQKDRTIKEKKLLPTLEGWFDSIHRGHVDKDGAASQLALLTVDDGVPSETINKIRTFLETYYPKSVAPSEADVAMAIRRLKPKAELHIVPTPTDKLAEVTPSSSGFFGRLKGLFGRKKTPPATEKTDKTPTDGDNRRAA